MNNINVSVVIPTKNEEVNLDKCLDCLEGFTEIIIVDSSSTDKTCKIAEERGVKVVDFKWDGKFPKKRNWALRNQTFENNWVLFLDSDEYITDEFKAEIASVLPAATHSGFWITYNNHFMNQMLKHGDKFKKLALFKVGSGEYERIEEDHWSHLDMEVHEHPVLDGTVGQLTAPIIHNDFKGLKAYINRHNAYSDWEAHRYFNLCKDSSGKWKDLTSRQRIKYKLLDSWLLAPIYFVSSYIFKAGFLDGSAGFMLAIFKMYYFFQIKCKIQELKTKSS